MDVERLDRPVSEVMTNPVRTVDERLAVSEASRVLWGEGIGALVVGEEPVRGILTESDVVRGVGAGHDPERMTVGQLMTEEVHTVTASTTVREACDTLSAEGVKKLPVTEDGELVGIVTTTDIAHSLAPSLDEVIGVFG